MRRWLALGLLALAGAVEAQPLTGGLLGRGAASAVPPGCTAGAVAVFLGSPVAPACAGDWSYTAGTPAVPETLGPEIFVNPTFEAGTDGWVLGDGWAWVATVGSESGCIQYTSPVNNAVQGVPSASFSVGSTYRVSIDVAGRNTGTVKLTASGAGDDTESPPATGTFTWEFTAVAAGGMSVFSLVPSADFDGSVCSASLVRVVAPPVPGTDSRVELTGAFAADSYSVNTLNDAPASATATCSVGEMRWTSTHFYFCPATNTWVRAALATWP